VVLTLESNDKDEEPVGKDWRKVLVDHIMNPSHSKDKKVQRQAMKYTLIDGKFEKPSGQFLGLIVMSQ
jgi:hypothetical protein